MIHCEVDCGDPSPIDHADMYVNATWLGQTVNYTCHDGYVHTSGSDQVTCLETGVWDVADMTCEVDCGDPSPVDHADMYVNATWLGQIVNYSCHDGYAHTSGSDQITCLETGAWDVANMTCEVDCGTPPPVLHAEMTVSGTWESNVAQYTCHVGFLPLGSAFVTCLQNGSWESPSYMCEEVEPPKELPVDKYGRTRTEKCICRCIRIQRKQEDIVAEISKKLTLNTKSLLSNVMTKESLPDERKSSHGMAYVAMSVIGTLFGVVFFSDIYYVINGIKRHLSVRG
ncbi:sushi, von Willebrand factor type A, EGF and pentraxin domain-containing protein 1-like [Haliotis rubra]|uniref:sushi, von Willebrand factor type A, EGF and pentraxin domain-containing protein 1-like n=1 Tax=Haliotis rubra TaxID=36100 RepID=UPI001EE52F2D|nr:sushi, von Willebrand factor type A, EGF and pentraxin domain-containing protein 1-like [Haliotis rubra]